VAVERRRTAALLKLEVPLALPESSQLADGQDALELASLQVAQRTLVAARLAQRERKMSASPSSTEQSLSAAEPLRE
jgi:hypothetical protein